MGIGKRIKHVYDRVDYSAGKKIFGNTVGIKHNLSGSMKKAQGGKSIMVNEFDDPRINDLRIKQHLILENAYDPSFIETLRSKYNALMENDETTYNNGEYEGKVYSKHIKEPHKNIPQLGKLLTDEIIKIVRGYYQGNFAVKHIGLWRNYHVPKEIEDEKELFSNNWHCDNRSTEYLKLFVPIEDITEDDGPFHIMSQQRTKELMKIGFGSRDEYNISDQILNDPKHVVKITGKTGMAYLANPQLCLHRAGNPSKGHRRNIICFVFGPASKPLPNDWFENFVQDEGYYKASNEK